MSQPSPRARGRILVIRGGAIGDFILTLPSLALLRENFPDAHIEVLGYRHIVALAAGRRYADASRSIEYAPLARFFARGAELDEELARYFASFHQIISYLYDPDRHFETNLRRCGARNILCAHPIVDDRQHAARQLAEPLQGLALYLEDHRPAVHLTEGDRRFARDFLAGVRPGPDIPLVALHAGSGSPRKNWPAARWAEIGDWLLGLPEQPVLLLVSGEADADSREFLAGRWAGHPRVRRVESVALTDLAGLLASCRLFLGHDSGISHLAAAVGTPSILLFGPTDPDVWGPTHPWARILRAPGGELERIDPGALRQVILEELARGRDPA